ncbi:MAG: ASCH domain-containing protein [Alphaproteobacteria bacterium]
MMHTMKVKTQYYRLLKTGKKTVELRLFDEKRQKIKIGDTICFSDLSDATDTFEAKVVALYPADSFEALCTQITPAQAGFESQEELLSVLAAFYPPEAQKEFGVLGIEISVEPHVF